MAGLLRMRHSFVAGENPGDARHFKQQCGAITSRDAASVRDVVVAVDNNADGAGFAVEDNDATTSM